ncbi:MAG: DUF3854 domain-containing protein [Waterburya sp.]
MTEPFDKANTDLSFSDPEEDIYGVFDEDDEDNSEDNSQEDSSFYEEVILSSKSLEDLQKSNLKPVDIKARPLGSADRAALNISYATDGYVIPYFAIAGTAVPFYRAKLIGENLGIKYIQGKNQPNHIYFPPGFKKLADRFNFVIITEGEKKAAALHKAGFPACAVAGVDNWRNRNIVLPKGVTLSKGSDDKIVGKLPSGGNNLEFADIFAIGLTDLIDYCNNTGKNIIIVYDTDVDTMKPWGITTRNVEVKPKYSHKLEVQRAAAALAHTIRMKGLPSSKIKQWVPHFPEKSQVDIDWDCNKLGVDDYLTFGKFEERVEFLREQIRNLVGATNAFPLHPAPKDYINKKLAGRAKRSDIQNIAYVMLMDLDASGSRMMNADDDCLYYFDNDSRSLIKVDFNYRTYPGSEFSSLIYNKYGVGVADGKVIEWLHTLYVGEGYVTKVRPRRVLFVEDDTTYYQVNDSTFVSVNANEIKMHDNGTMNILFESGHTDNIDTGTLQKAINKAQSEEIDNWWYSTLLNTRLRESEGDRQRQLLSYLFYISPWFYKWRNTELPLEIACGEAGSGKSSLYVHRLGVTTGTPKLRNAPKDIKDWTASVANAGGLHVVDNVHMSNKTLKQELSDEMCRLITSSNPTIEARKLYSNNELVTVPVSCVFVVTAIQMPFTNVDIMQRSIVIDFDKGDDIALEYQMDWTQEQMDKFGGRAAWLAHHLVMVQKVYKNIRESWTKGYKAKFRLINLEQLLVMVANVFGDDGDWISAQLEKQRDERVADSDWALQGIDFWASYTRKSDKHWKTKRYTVADIIGMLEYEPEFAKNYVFSSTRILAKYLQTHKHTIATSCGLVEAGKLSNKTTYKLNDIN